MDKKTHAFFKAKIKELKKRIQETDNEGLKFELEHTEDSYSYLQTEQGWNRYKEALSK